MSSDIAVSARNVSKSYRIVHAERATTLGESIAKRLRNPLQRTTRETFWALKGIEFDIRQGDVVGIIGRNGAGKSTLLKVLSRITAPTTGEITVRGRVGSLLEVGTGFHPELTGRENVYLNGSILGMKKREIDSQFDAIVEFSGVEQFLDTPVKRYSSGMYVRLAFAVAAHLEPEILIVDEVLAVGDSDFQKKCIGKMNEVAKSGRTVLFVSHNMQTISQMCTSGIFLQNGHIAFHGSIEETTDKYINTFDIPEANVDINRRKGTGEFRVTAVDLNKKIYTSGEPISAKVRIEHQKGHIPVMFARAHIYDSHGIVIVECDSQFKQTVVSAVGDQTYQFVLKGVNLKPGTYRFGVDLHYKGMIDNYEDAAYFDISPVLPNTLGTGELGYQYGMVIGEFDWQKIA